MKTFKKTVLAAAILAAGLSIAGWSVDAAAAAPGRHGSKWPIVKIESKCYKQIYREKHHNSLGNSPAGSLTGCSGCFYGYDSHGAVVMYRPVPCSR